MSETFIYDALVELERFGWNAWLATERLEHRDWFPFPPDDRILQPTDIPIGRRVWQTLSPSGSTKRFSERFLCSAAAMHPAVIHAHFGWSGCDALPLALTLKVPLVVTFHASDVLVWGRFRHRERPAAIIRGEAHRYSRLFESQARVVTVSEFMAAQLRALGYNRDIDIIPAGVRLDQFPYRDPPCHEAVRLAFVGRQVPRKGLDVLLRALPLVLSKFPSVRLTVVGGGASFGANVALARRLGVESQVTMLGARPVGAVKEVLTDADIFVMCSRTMPNGEAEGSPVATKEALAVGLPVVATANGGTGETLPPELRHELVPENDPSALANAICALIDARPSWLDRARAGREYVEAQFDWTVLASRTSRLYEDAIRAHNAAHNSHLPI